MAKLLLVEDDNNLRDIYQARLAAEGYEISSAQDGEEALVVAKQAKPDLIISDVMMPKISGFEMLDILRNTPGLENVRVIMLTALGQSEDQQRADSLGADKYLVKSQVTLEDIVKTAKELLDGETQEAADAVAASGATSDSEATAPAQPAVADVPVAPAPEPEPVAEAPAPEPVAETPQTEPVAPAPEEAAPAATTSPVSDSSDDTSTPQPQPEPTTPTDTTAADDTQATTDANAAADDQLVENAVNELTGGETGSAEPAPAEAEPAAAGSKKVISPIQGDAKPSLDELVAKEEAAESAPADAAVPTSAPEASSEAPAEPAAEEPVEEPKDDKGNDKVDPNSLAL